MRRRQSKRHRGWLAEIAGRPLSSSTIKGRPGAVLPALESSMMTFAPIGLDELAEE